jgi:hypothetical protein
MGTGRVVGIVLLSVSVFAIVQTAREVAQGVNAEWTETPLNDTVFAFAGRSIEITKQATADARSEPARVQQERVRIDGVDMGTAVSTRMATWAFLPNQRSPHWFDALKFVDRAGGDSSLWLARRLQVADSVPPRFEIITVDAQGNIGVHQYAQDEVRSEYRVRAATALIAENSRSQFSLSVVGLALVPYLLLVFPIGTGLVGIVLIRQPRGEDLRVRD